MTVANPKSGFFAGATPSRLIVIGILAVVLMGVVTMQFVGEATLKLEPRRKKIRSTVDTIGDSKVKSEKPLPNQTFQSKDETNAEKTERRIVRDWPQFSLNELQAHDPFALSPSVVEKILAAADVQRSSPDAQDARTQRLSLTLKQLQDKGVRLVVIGDQERVARIGNLEVRVGDDIEGFRVAEIHPDKIVLIQGEE